MNNTPNSISREIDQLCKLVKNDSINLTRDDQDFLCMKIEELRAAIQKTYEDRREKSGLDE